MLLSYNFCSCLATKWFNIFNRERSLAVLRIAFRHEQVVKFTQILEYFVMYLFHSFHFISIWDKSRHFCRIVTSLDMSEILEIQDKFQHDCRIASIGIRGSRNSFGINISYAICSNSRVFHNITVFHKYLEFLELY